ncbi:hypothetical protein ES703_48967 [subsurface metagenome]
MPSQVLKDIAADFKRVDPAIAEAEELIAAMREAGEDTVSMEAELRVLKTRKTKWERMLKARGLV